MRILISDDHEAIRKGVCTILSSRLDIEVYGEAVNGREAIDKAKDGRCTTPCEIKTDDQCKERWAELCQEFSGNQDPQKAAELLREAGRLFRGAVATPDPLTGNEMSRDVAGN